ncbi:MAG: hypothetical protein AB9836_06070 [Aminipila sp.]
MDKQAILQWANNLIEQYEEVSETVIEETSNTIDESLSYLRQECKELKEEIKELLEIGQVKVGDRIYSVDVKQDIEGVIPHDIDNIVITSEDILLKGDAYDDVICTLSNLNNGSLYCDYQKVFRTEEEANNFLNSLDR